MSIHFKSSVSCGQAAPEIAEFTGDSQHTHISFSSGQFPASLNTPGLVTPLLKKPGLNVDDYKNYSPVTNLSAFSKILERLTLVRLKPHSLTSASLSRIFTSLLLQTTAHCSQPTVNCTQRRLLL